MTFNVDLVVAIAASLATTIALIFLISFLTRRARVVKLLGFPLYVAAVAAGIKVFELFGVVQGEERLDEILTWLVVFLASILILRLVGVYFFDVYLHTHRGHRLPPLLPNVVMWMAYMIVGFLSLKLMFKDLDITGIVAASAVTSLVLGLALQPILGNFFSGLVISVERPFRINDWILVNGPQGLTEGRIAKITWRTTHIRTRDNDNLVVPNSKIADDDLINFYYPHPLHMERVFVGVHYRTPPYRVKQALMAAANRVEGVLEKPDPEVFCLDFGESSILYETRIWLEDFAHKPRIVSQVRSEIWEEFHRQGITIPFPIRTLEIEPRVNTVQVTEPPPVDLDSPSRALLYVARGPLRGQVVRLGSDAITVGRSDTCHLSLNVPHVSKQHFSVELKDGSFMLTDLDSQFGTKVNDEPVESRALRDLDKITIGEVTIVFENDVG